MKDGPIEFNIPGNTYHYVDLKHSKLSLKLKLTQENKLPIATGNKVGLVNNILHSIFSQCELRFQQQDTTKGISSNYPYKAYLDVITSSNTKLREDCLSSQLFFKDSPGFMDDVDSVAGANIGLYLRSKYTSEGKVVDLEGPLYADLCQQDRLIINGVQIGLRLRPHRDEFSLVTIDDLKYKFEITEAVFKVCFVKITLVLS